MAMGFDGKRIKAAAAQAGYSLTELAVRLGISRATLYAYVANNINPPEERVKQLADLTGCSVDFFVSKPEPGVVMAQVDASLQLVDALLSAADPAAAAAVLEACIMDVPRERRGELMLKTGNALVMAGEYQQAIPHLVRASAEFRSVADQNGQGRCCQSLGLCYAHVGPLETARSLFIEAEGLMAEENRWKPRIALAVVEERRGNFAAALEMVEKAHGKDAAESLLLHCGGVRSNILSSLGDWEKVFEEEKRLVDLAIDLGSRDQTAERLVMVAQASIYVNDPKTEYRIAQAEGFLQASGDMGRTAYFMTVRSAFALQTGDFALARGLALEAIGIAVSGKYRRAELWAQLRHAEVAVAEENDEEASAAFLKASAYAESYEYTAERYYADASGALMAAKLGKDRKASELISKVQPSRNPIDVAIIREASSKLEKGIWDRQRLVKHVNNSGIKYLPGYSRTTSRKSKEGE